MIEEVFDRIDLPTQSARGNSPDRFQIIVRLDKGLPEQALKGIAKSQGSRLEKLLLSEDSPSANGKGSIYVLSFPDTPAREHIVEALSHRPGIELAELDSTVHSMLTSNDTLYGNGILWGMLSASTGNQYGTGADAAWGRSDVSADGKVGSMRTVVGVIDTGIDPLHPDLYLNIWINQNEIPYSLATDQDGDGIITFRDLNVQAAGNYVNSVTDLNANGRIDADDLLLDSRWANGIDDDTNGYLDDLFGWDFRGNDNRPFEAYNGSGSEGNPADSYHGTHVAGTIGAQSNTFGVVGVNWDVQIMPMRFLGPPGVGGSTADALEAIYYYTAMGLANPELNFVGTNNSWGGGSPDQFLADAITDAGNNGHLFVVAAGNSSSNNNGTPSYPSSYVISSTFEGVTYDPVIAVASIDSNGALSSFSNFGSIAVDIAAPGGNIASTLAGSEAFGGYTNVYLSGTSMASPHVTGAVALISSEFPGLHPADLKSAILNGRTAYTALNGQVATGGRLNIPGSIALVGPAPAITISDSLLTLADPSTTVTFSFSEAVVGFSLADISVSASDGTVSGLTTANNIVWTATFTPANVETQAAQILVGNRFTSATGDYGRSGESALFAIDRIAPLTTVSTIAATKDGSGADVDGTLSAPLGSGEVLAVYRNGTPLGNATVNGTNWHFDDTTALPDGTYQYTARVVDAAANDGALSSQGTLVIASSMPAPSIVVSDTLLNLADAPATVIFTFSEAVTGFDASDISVTAGHGTITGLTTANNTVWTATFTPADVETQTAKISVGSGYTSSVGSKPGTAGESAAFTIDRIAPSVTVSSITATIDGVGANVDGTLNAALGSGDLLKVYRDGNLLGNASVAGTSWHYDDLTTLANGTYQYTARVVDAAANDGALSSQGTLVIASSMPAPSIVVSDTLLNLADAPATVIFTFSEAVTGFDASDISVTAGHGTITGLTTANNTVWTATFTPADVETQTAKISVGSGYTSSVGSKPGTAGESAAFTIDRIAPSVTVSSITATIDGVGANVDGTLNAALGSGDLLKVYRDGNLLGNASVAGTSWHYDDLTTLANGTYQYTARVVDAAANDGALSSQGTLVIASSMPAPSIVVSDTLLNLADAPATVIFTFSEAVTGFDASDISVTAGHGTITGLTTANNTVWTATFTPADVETQTAKISVGSGYTSSVGSKPGTAGESAAFTIDRIAPSVTVSSITATIDGVGANVDGTLNAALGSGDLLKVYRDGNLLGNASVAGTSWHYDDLTTLANGTYQYTARVVDAAANDGALSSQGTLVIASVTTDFTLTLGVTHTGSYGNFGFGPDEMVTGSFTGTGQDLKLTVRDWDINTPTEMQVLINGSHLGYLTPTATYKFGETILTIPASMQLAGNNILTFLNSSITNYWGITSARIDALPTSSMPAPSIVVSDTLLNLADAPATVTFTFSEAVTGFDASDISVTAGHGTITGLTTANNTVWTATFTPADVETQTAKISVGSGYTSSVGSKPGTAGESAAFTIDRIAPSVTVSSITATIDGVGANVDGTLNAALGSGDLLKVYRDGNLLGNASVAGTSWHYDDLTTLANGTYQYTARVVDAAANDGALSSQGTLVIASSMPAPSIVVSDTLLNLADAPATVIFTFSEAVTGFDASDISVTAGHGTITGLTTANNTVWTATFTPADVETQTAKISVGSGYTSSVGSKPGTAGESAAFTIDRIAPSVTVSSITATIDGVGANVDGTLNAALGSGDLLKVYRDGNLLGNASVAGTSWHYDDLTTLANGTYQYTARVVDAAANDGALSSQGTLVIASVTTDFTLTLGVTHTGSYGNFGFGPDEMVTGSFTGTGQDLKLTVRDWDINTPTEMQVLINGSHLGYLTPTATYKFGETILTIPASMQLAGNNILTFLNSSITNYWGITSARIDALPTSSMPAPSIVVSDTLLNLADAPATVIFTFSEAVTGFDASDISVTAGHGTITGLTTANNTVWTATFTPADVETQTAKISVGSGYTSSVGSKPGTAGESAAFTIDRIAPSVTVSSITATIDGVGANVDGTLNAALGSGDLLKVYRDGNLLGNASVAGTSWHYDDLTTLANGTYQYTARVVDAAANDGALSSQGTLVIASVTTDFTLTLGVTHTGSYGNFGFGPDEMVTGSFTGTGQDLKLTVRDWDINTPTEMQVLINGSHLGYLTPTATYKFGETILTIPASMQLAGNNILTFLNSSITNYWGITSARIDALPTSSQYSDLSTRPSDLLITDSMSDQPVRLAIFAGKSPDLTWESSSIVSGVGMIA